MLRQGGRNSTCDMVERVSTTLTEQKRLDLLSEFFLLKEGLKVFKAAQRCNNASVRRELHCTCTMYMYVTISSTCILPLLDFLS